MSWEYWILLVLLLLSSALVLAGQKLLAMPSLQPKQNQVRLAQGVIGLLTLLWGLACLVMFLTNRNGFFILVALLAMLLAIGLGLLLGYRLIRRQATVPSAVEAGDKVEAKLSRNQFALGVAGLAAVVLLLIFELSSPSVPSYDPTPAPAPVPRTNPLPIPPLPAPVPTPTP